MSKSNKIVLLLSGGMDSATLLALAKQTFTDVAALSVDYAQRHRKELESARAIADYYNVQHKILDITNINDLLKGSSLTSDISVPHGHYADETMKSTVVPARNTILLSLAAGWAISMNFFNVGYGAHAGDHAIYPDCRPQYVSAMRKVFSLFDYTPITLWAPFINVSKTEILTKGIELKVPYELTWTCYEGKVKACGKCGSCVERLEAFKENNQIDPLSYIGGDNA